MIRSAPVGPARGGLCARPGGPRPRYHCGGSDESDPASLSWPMIARLRLTRDSRLWARRRPGIRDSDHHRIMITVG
eukprot:699917-Hanusia_phi.AAC.1